MQILESLPLIDDIPGEWSEIVGGDMPGYRNHVYRMVNFTPASYVREVKAAFPNNGFHKCLARVATRWIIRHPLNPVPIIKW